MPSHERRGREAKKRRVIGDVGDQVWSLMLDRSEKVNQYYQKAFTAPSTTKGQGEEQ